MQFLSFLTNHKGKTYAQRNIMNVFEVQLLPRCLPKHTKWIQVQGHKEQRTQPQART